MIILRHTQPLIFGSDLEISGAYGGAAAVSWWLSGGIVAANCLAAYTPKGAASLAASYDNNAAPGNGLPDGTYDAAPGTAPTLVAGGWSFVAASLQYLTTGVVPATGYSAIIQFSGAAFVSNKFLMGSYGGATSSQLLGWYTSGFNRFAYQNGGVLFGSAFAAAGNIAVSGTAAYLNGLAEAGAMGAWAGANTFGNYIGAYNNAGVGPLGYITATVAAAAIYNTILTAPQVLAVATAMAAL